MIRRSALFLTLIMLAAAALACNLGGAVPTEPAAPTEPPAEPTEEPTEEAAPTATTPPADPTDAPTATTAPTAQPTATTAPTAEPIREDVVNPDTLYGVVMVREDDVLNVRTGPGVENDIIAEFLPIFAGIEVTGDAARANDGGIWVPVSRLEVDGWVNRRFLTEVVTPDDFCAQPAAETVVDRVIEAVDNQNGNELASLVHPVRGLLIRYNWWNQENRLSQSEVTGLFTSTQSRVWGQEQGTGDDLVGTPSEVIVPLLEEDLLASNRQRACNDILAGGTAGLVQTPPEYQGLNYYSVYRPPTADQVEFNWGSWVIGIEYWGGTPYLAYLIHYEWEI